MERIAILYGGRSLEHEISIITALQAIQALDPLKYEIFLVYLSIQGKWYTGDPLFERSFYKTLPEGYDTLREITLLPDPSVGGFIDLKSNKVIPTDLCLLLFHGQYGEDGSIQGLLELADLPYTGSGVLASSLAMSKAHAKSLLKGEGFEVLPWVTIRKEEAILSLKKVEEKILKTLSFPLFVKPNHLGSSIGVSEAKDLSSLRSALAKVFQYDTIALIEPLLTDFIEINVAVLDDIPPIGSLIEIPISSKGILSYEDKYMRGGSKIKKESEGMASLTRILDPQDLSIEFKNCVIEKAISAFLIFNASGVCRFDFMFDQKKKMLFFNEVNTIPGSMAFYLFDQKNPSLFYTESLDSLIRRAKKVKRIQNTLTREFGFHAL